MTDPRDMLETYAAEERDFGREWGRSDRDELAPHAFDALRAVLDIVDIMESNAVLQETDGTDPMIVHQKRHDMKCVRLAITTALGGDQ